MSRPTNNRRRPRTDTITHQISVLTAEQIDSFPLPETENKDLQTLWDVAYERQNTALAAGRDDETFIALRRAVSAVWERCAKYLRLHFPDLDAAQRDAVCTWAGRAFLAQRARDIKLDVPADLLARLEAEWQRVIGAPE